MSAAPFEFDAEKDKANIRKHGLSFSAAQDIEWRDVSVVPDDRRDYREPRYQIYGKVADRLHVLVVTPRDGRLRIISFRKANRREVRKHG